MDIISPTGFHGTPTNFRILAVADFSKGRKLGRKMATMGYFTNIGTVFTAGTTDWANSLDDDIVKQMTKNVMRILSERKIGPPMTLLPKTIRPVPGLDWSVMRDAPKDALAICALYQGDLLLQKGEGKIQRSDAEIPLSEWETTIPRVVDLVSLGTSYSSYIFAISSSDGLKYREITASKDSNWQEAINQPAGTPIGVAARRAGTRVASRVCSCEY